MKEVPDTADALACTFAMPVPIDMPEDGGESEARRQAVLNYEPMAAIR
jgi:hypothetical protein